MHENVSIVNRVHTGSDHIMVRTKIKINTKLERRKLFHTKCFPTTKTIRKSKEKYQQELKPKLTPLEDPNTVNLDELSQKITNKNCSEEDSYPNATKREEHSQRNKRANKFETRFCE